MINQKSTSLLSILVYLSFLFQISISVRLAGVTPQLKEEFLKWAEEYAKKYPNQQTLVYRMGIYSINRIKVFQHNQRYDEGLLDYSLEMNKFADLTRKQWKQIYGQIGMLDMIQNTIQIKKRNLISNGLKTSQCTGIINDAPNPPLEVDWIQRAVSNVKDQGSCGSNWAFTSIGAIQGLYSLKRGKLVNFSEQQIIDCSHDYGNQGCRGGFMDQAFWYIIDNGITSDELYPYKAVDARCTYSPSMKVASFQHCARVPSENYSKLLSAIVQQPTSVAVDASDFQLYSEGIYTGNCTDDIDRGMLLVGYGGDNVTTHYWKLKNSVGADWGMKGYIMIEKLEKDGPGKCGIQLAASVPQIIL